jgi:hypothetical protein
MERNGRFDHIEDVLVDLHSGQWFGWSDSKNKVYANLIIHNSDYDKPSKSSLTDALTTQQSAFDAKEYARNRESEYPTIAELTIALYDEADKSALVAKRNAVKLKYPKPS